MDTAFLSLAEVLDLHADQIEAHGGSAGVRDKELLQSALEMPKATFGGQHLHEFPHGMAAAYLFHLCANHPFIDGNKRTALATALVFLEVNNVTVDATIDEMVYLTLGVASGTIDKPAVIEFFRRHVPARAGGGDAHAQT